MFHISKNFSLTENETDVETFAEKMSKIDKEKSRQEEFYRPHREYVGDEDVKDMGFEARKSFFTEEKSKNLLNASSLD